MMSGRNDNVEANNTREAWQMRQTLLARAKLKEASRISTLLSGFAMVAMVEVDLNTCTNSTQTTCTVVPEYILIMFAAVTTVLISVYLISLMVATCILPNLQAVKSHSPVARSIIPSYERFQHYITIAWAFSTVLGIILFMAEFGLICWIKFWYASRAAAWLATAILIPVAFIFLGFALHFHRSLLEHKIEEHDKGLQELDQLASQLSQFHHENGSIDSTTLLASTMPGNRGGALQHV